ncbi:MAG: hypothetical protein GXO99_01100 [Nitrospirae bacterium]|nr:hypothetical protein [Nitrospirota bacterium]
MIYSVLFVLTVIIVVYSILPLVKEKYWPFVNVKRLKEISEEKTTGMWAITDIENEYQMGKLTEKDYQLLREQFKREIIPLLKKEQELVGSGGLKERVNGDLDDDVRQKMLMEVLRICGKDMSS